MFSCFVGFAEAWGGEPGMKHEIPNPKFKGKPKHQI
jgi:hypothetical protein